MQAVEEEVERLSNENSLLLHRMSQLVASHQQVDAENQQLRHVPGIAEFVQLLTSDATTGPDGYLVMKGLLPLPPTEHMAMQEVAAKLAE